MSKLPVWVGLIVISIAFITCTGNQDPVRSDKSLDIKEVAKSVSPDSISGNDSSGVEEKIIERTGKVRRNDSFYRIFGRLGISEQRIYELTTRYKELLESFEMKPGQSYRYQVIKEDSAEELIKFVWEPNRRDFLVFNLRDTLAVNKNRKKQTIKRVTATGKIESSLYETFMGQQLPIELAFKLSELYAWEIDFFLLRERDAFKVLYEELYVEGERVGIGNILAADFRHREESYKAYRFYNGSGMGYYNPDGESLQKALLKAPLKYRYISSGYSHSRYHPILHRRMPHYGIDYVAPRGTPVVSVGDGTVLTARYKGANGNMVKIRHNSTYTTSYIHLSRFAEGIGRGTNVGQGEVIGYVGSTGRSTGSHLDYRIYKSGKPVNPQAIDLPPSDGIEESKLKAFRHARRQLDRILDGLEVTNERRTRPVTHSPVSNNDEDDVGKSS